MKQDYYRERIGDLEEAYRDLVEEAGLFRARVWLCSEIIKLCFGVFRIIMVWRFVMLKNYFKVALRNIKRHKGYSILNISGLTIGFACFIFIFLFIRYELSFDRQHTKADRIYNAIYKFTGDYTMGTPKEAHSHPLLAPTLMNEFPEIETATRFSKYNNVMVRVKDQKFLFDKWVWADEHIFDVFDLPFVYGNPKTALDKPFSVVIDEDTAGKLFGHINPVGKTLQVIRGKEMDFQVTGVMKNLPPNSHFQPNLLGQFETQISLGLSRSLNSWDAHWFHSYLLLKKGSYARELETKIQSFIEQKLHPLSSSQNWTYLLLPLTDIHLKSTDVLKKLEEGGDIKSIYICSLIAVLILFIAGINFINLSTARSFTRSREVSIRKVVGAYRSQLIKQFLGESLIFTAISLIAAVGFVLLALKGFAHIMDREMTAHAIIHPEFILGLLAAFILVGFISGFYPSLYLSGFKPLILLKGPTPRASKSLNLRNFLVVFQFAISLFLIISTLIISGQIHLIRTKKLGFDRDHVVVINLNDDKIRQTRDIIKNELLLYPGINGVTFTQTLPTNINWDSDFDYEGRGNNEYPFFYYSQVDYDYVDFFNMEITDGRNFSREMTTDAVGGGAFILNQTAVKHLGWEDPVGKKIGFPEGEKMGTVVGVVKDFNCHSLHFPGEPAVLILNTGPWNIYFLSIKVKPENITHTLGAIEKVWKKHSDGYPFEYYFLDEAYDNLYKSEIRLNIFFRLFTLIAIIISSLGLFGLASFTAERRTKEIGIRKVLGASLPSIVIFISRGFTKWVLLANIIAWPVAYYFMNKWLQNFAYRIDLSVWIFLLSGLAAFIIALLTVSYQSIKAATANPVDSLRYE
ncbi:MAG: ABC transporter permease [Candidatus Aminicenantes bacterium]|nr:MAG: ABC transporter permease [Candidatus Aminicenantes bacterium]